MDFMQAEAEAKKGKRVRVRNNSFSGDGVVEGTTGTVINPRPSGMTVSSFMASGGSIPNPTRDAWVVDIQFDDPAKTLIEHIGKDYYEGGSLEEI